MFDGGGACPPCGVHQSIGVPGMVEDGMCIEGGVSRMATGSNPFPKPPLQAVAINHIKKELSLQDSPGCSTQKISHLVDHVRTLVMVHLLFLSMPSRPP